jgi:hypothetical protein
MLHSVCDQTCRACVRSQLMYSWFARVVRARPWPESGHLRVDALGGVKIVTTRLREERVRSLVAGMGERVHRCIQSCLARVRSSLDCKGTVN